MGPTPHYYDEKGADDAAMWLCGNKVGRRQVGKGAAAKGTSSRGMSLLHHDEGVRVMRPSASVGSIGIGSPSPSPLPSPSTRVFASVEQGVKGKPELGGGGGGGGREGEGGRGGWGGGRGHGQTQTRMGHSDSLDSLTLPTPRQEQMQRSMIHNARWTEKTIPRRRYRPSERSIGGTRRAPAAFSESSMGHGNVITWGGDETKTSSRGGGGGGGGGGGSRSALRSSASASLVQRTPFALDSVNEPTFVRVSRYG